MGSGCSSKDSQGNEHASESSPCPFEFPPGTAYASLSDRYLIIAPESVFNTGVYVYDSFLDEFNKICYYPESTRFSGHSACKSGKDSVIITNPKEKAYYEYSNLLSNGSPRMQRFDLSAHVKTGKFAITTFYQNEFHHILGSASFNHFILDTKQSVSKSTKVFGIKRSCCQSQIVWQHLDQIVIYGGCGFHENIRDKIRSGNDNEMIQKWWTGNLQTMQWKQKTADNFFSEWSYKNGAILIHDRYLIVIGCSTDALIRVLDTESNTLHETGIICGRAGQYTRIVRMSDDPELYKKQCTLLSAGYIRERYIEKFSDYKFPLSVERLIAIYCTNRYFLHVFVIYQVEINHYKIDEKYVLMKAGLKLASAK